MNVHFQQSTRLARIETAIGQDDLALLRFEGEEQVNSLFAFEVDALSARGDIDFDALIGTHLTAEVDHPDHGVQPFDGIVTQARYKGTGENGYKYGFKLRPWLWLTGKRRNQRIFHEMSVVEILQELFEPYANMGSPAYELRLAKEYPKLEYTVQFAESDLEFACRMMERFGISYFFAHDAQSHTMVLVDKVSGFYEVPGMRRPFYSADQHRNVEIEHFWEWLPERNFTTGKIRLTDYNFKTPGAKMETFARGESVHAYGGVESFDWPGRYLELGRGEDVEVGMRVEQERGQDHRHYATGDCLTLRAGRRVELSGDQVHNATGTVFGCLAAQHTYVSNQYGSGGDGEESHGYTGSYILTPNDAPLSPRRKTPLARVHGPQTARVVGEGEIDCDEYGRILVRFHWDLHDSYSMRCRVSQNWAGNGWGGMVIPRIGMEVLVEFLDGDPDKPMVTGCVYNGRNRPPYELPANKTKSVFRTDTHKDDPAYGFNELTFEDEHGREEVFLRASKDLTVKVDNHATRRVSHNDVASVGGDQLIDVEKSRNTAVGHSYSISVGTGPGGTMIDGKERDDPFGLRPAAYAIETGSFTTGKGSYSVRATGSMRLETDKAFVLDVETAARTRVGKSATLNVGENYRESVTGNSKEVVGKRKVIDAHEEILIRCGISELRMKSDGSITLNGKKLDVTQSDTIAMKAGRIDLN